MVEPLWESENWPLCRLSAGPHEAGLLRSAVCCPQQRKPGHTKHIQLKHKASTSTFNSYKITNVIKSYNTAKWDNVADSIQASNQGLNI